MKRGIITNTGPVVKLAGSSLDKARAVLTASGYL